MVTVIDDKTKWWKWLLLIVVLLAVSWRLGQEVVSYPASYESQNFVGIKQPDNITCGPTSVAMVMRHRGIEADVMDVAGVSKTHLYQTNDGKDVGGTTPLFVSIALNHFGISSSVQRECSMDTLKRYVSQDRTPIALVRSGKTLWHYVVVVGYKDDKIIVYDPWLGHRVVMNAATFESSWAFLTDLRGHDTSQPCPFCVGDGRLVDWLGPLGKCDFCSGSGKRPDVMRLLMEMGEQKAYILIVPDKGIHEH